MIEQLGFSCIGCILAGMLLATVVGVAACMLSSMISQARGE